MAGPIGLDLPAVYTIFDENGIIDPIDRERFLARIMVVYDVVMDYQGLYKEMNRARVQAEAERARAVAAEQGKRSR